MDRYPPVMTATQRPARVDAAPLEPRTNWLPWLMVLGLVSLGTSIFVVTLTLNRWPSETAPSEPPDGTSRRTVAVAYVDVEGGVRPLFPGVPGRVIAASVPEGQEVEEGTVLLQLDDAIPKKKLRAAELELRAAEERLLQARKLIPQHQQSLVMQEGTIGVAKNKLAAAKAQAGKAKRLFKEDLAGGKEDVEAANSLVEEAREGLRVAMARLEQTKMLEPQSAVKLAETDVQAKIEAVEAAKLAVDQCRITAPCKGVILRRLVNVGEILGQMQTRPAIEFCPSGDRIVRAEVEQEFAGKLRIGQQVQISDAVTGSGNWSGEVVRISDWFTQRRAVLLEPMQYNDIRTLEVIIRLKSDPKNVLRINQRVRVKLDGDD